MLRAMARQLSYLKRHALQILVMFGLTSFLLMVVLNQSENELAASERVRRHKEELRERLRQERLSDYQSLLFQTRIQRPADHTYNLNVTRSENTPLDREVPDTRPDECNAITYDLSSLPTVSVIIPFYNEALSMLLRAVHSILARTPPELLVDIILINDHSTNADLGEPLRRYVKLLPDKVQLLETAKREGLIRARLIGARKASGDVLMFQDAHTENNVRWAEPLLAAIAEDPTTIIQPTVEQIEANTIEYIGASMAVPRGGFAWDLRYTWMAMPEHELERIGYAKNVPFRTPTLVGCALAVRKDYFFRIGAFDDGMNVWGGENIELAFRNWMCGGRVLCHPCSRVAHVFKDFSYSFDGDKEKIVEKNLMRLAEMWMDEYKTFFYAATYTFDFKRTYMTAEDLTSLRARRKLKEDLKCKSFNWYLNTIVPEIPVPSKKAKFYGELANEQTGVCWAPDRDGYVTMTSFCWFHRVLPENLFHLTNDGRLMHRDHCINVELSTFLLKLGDCNSQPVEQVWRMAERNTLSGMIHVDFTFEGVEYRKCIAQVTNINRVHYNQQMPQAFDCDENDMYQSWRWTYKFSFDYDLDKNIVL